MSRNIKESTDVLQSVVDGIQEQFDKGNKSVNVFTAPARMPIVNQFALIFHNNFLMTIDEYKLALNDIRIMLKIIDLMKFGNLVKLSWSDVARSLDIDPTNMGRHIKKLKKAALLIEDNGGNTYLNPQIIAKGKFLENSSDKTLIEILNIGADAIDGTNVTPSIITDKIRNKQIEKNKQHSLLNILDEPKKDKYNFTTELEEALNNYLHDNTKEDEFFNLLPEELKDKYLKKKFDFLIEKMKEKNLPKEFIDMVIETKTKQYYKNIKENEEDYTIEMVYNKSRHKKI